MLCYGTLTENENLKIVHSKLVPVMTDKIRFQEPIFCLLLIFVT